MFEALPYSLPKCVGKQCQQRLSRPIICILPTRWHNDVNYQRKLILCVRRRGCCNAIGVGLMRLFEKEIIIDTRGTVCYPNSKGKSASKSCDVNLLNGSCPDVDTSSEMTTLIWERRNEPNKLWFHFTYIIITTHKVTAQGIRLRNKMRNIVGLKGNSDDKVNIHYTSNC